MTMSTMLHELLTARVPRKLSVPEVRELLGVAPFRLFPFLGGVRLKVGVPYSRFVVSEMEEHLIRGDTPEAYLGTFMDEGRFQGIQSLWDFLRSPLEGVAKGQRLALPGLVSEELASRVRGVRCFAGHAGQVSDLHFDWDTSSNLLVNLHGIKSIQLIGPELSHLLKGFSNISLVALPETAATETVGPGEALFMPAFWWHQVTYVEQAVSLSLRLAAPVPWELRETRLYPSWKFLQLVARPGGLERIREFVARLEGRDPTVIFSLLEAFYRECLGGIVAPDHPFYEPWAWAQIHFQQRNPDQAG